MNRLTRRTILRVALVLVSFTALLYGCTVNDHDDPSTIDHTTDSDLIDDVGVDTNQDSSESTGVDKDSDEYDTGFGSDAVESDEGIDTSLDGGSTDDGNEDSSDPDSDLASIEEGRIVGYYTSWSIYARDYHVADIPADKITHLNYAFANISENGEVIVGDSWADVEKTHAGDTWDQPLKGNFNQLIKLKEANPSLKTLISVGGWTWSGRFSDIALSQASRKKFAVSAVKFAVKYGFDGVDIDWEYPGGGGLQSNGSRPQDKQNFTLLMKELRQQLDVQGHQDGTTYLLTAATAAGTEKIANLEVSKLMQYVDWINIMTYDFHGAWDSTTNHHSPLYGSQGQSSSDDLITSFYNTDSAVNEYLTNGAQSHKLCVGIPFYGRAWMGVPNIDNGLFQSSTGVPPGTWDDWASGSTGVNDYWQIKEFEHSGLYTRRFDDSAKAPFLYSDTEHGGHMISYEDRESLSHKLNYAAEKKLGGMMFWDLSGDVKDNPDESLVQQMFNFYY